MDVLPVVGMEGVNKKHLQAGVLLLCCKLWQLTRQGQSPSDGGPVKRVGRKDKGQQQI